jgi:signal transduction histidine kinase
MSWIRDLSIRNKLTAMMVLTTGIVLALASAGVVISEVIRVRRGMLQELEVLADVTGTNSISPVAFNDAVAARDTLAALRSKPGIVVARILTPTGKLFATYAQDGRARGSDQSDSGEPTNVDITRALRDGGYNEWGRRLVLVRRMSLEGDVVGVIQIESSLDELQATIRNLLLTAGGAATGLCVVALLLAYRFQRVISQPIEQLTATMARVSHDKNYALRAEKTSEDELGVLIVGFNDMLSQIEAGNRQLQKHRDELEMLVASRTAELAKTNEQLIAASRHKSEFLANMSHELRTPLNAVIGFSEVLVERMFGDLNAKQAQYAQIILSSGRHLLALINDILDLSKVEAGRMDLDVSRFDVRATLESAVSLVNDRAARHNITLALHIDSELGDFVGDERKIKQVVLNLLSNAVKFTRDSGRVEVRARIADTGMQISVSDTGVGIAAEDRDAIFEEFRQVGTGPRREGTGLGLTLARKFVELHGGNIEVTSELGQGSTFTCTFPIRQAPLSM